MKPDKSSLLDWLTNWKLFPWLDPKIFAIIALIGLFSLAMSWSEPLPQAKKFPPLVEVKLTAAPTQGITATSMPASGIRPPTPVPEEWQTNREMADGIIFGAVILVVIILGGTLFVIRRR